MRIPPRATRLALLTLILVGTGSVWVPLLALYLATGSGIRAQWRLLLA